ncbi:uncharacterized protein At3g49140-like isoform X2 [Andrographis paniculata]|uniref:uncharacterized protein At3g49140-like isoform X2 n=1 Tax=Andrographis paniculata TaxID=175694 RepID=UPI0021E95B7E|nr:uncharacterized protein At3g49140-like isoform X2 [Andrographis paniculata]
MLMIEPQAAASASASASRLCPAYFYSSSRVFSKSASLLVRRDGSRRCGGRAKCGNGISGKSSSDSGPVKQNAKPQRYHPFEEIADSNLLENGEAATLTPAETSRTIIEVNSKATLMFSGTVNEDVHENIFWPDLPYVTDEHGNIYFQVKNDEDILQALTTEETVVQVIIGLDTAEMISEMEALGHGEIDFGLDELEDVGNEFDEEDEDDDEDDDDEDDDDNYNDDWVSILDEEDQDEESDGSLGDWAKLETMRSSHPMYFAKKLAEVASDDPVDFMEQPSAGIAIHGILRPAFLEEHSVIRRHIPDPESSDVDTNRITREQSQESVTLINGHRHETELPQDFPNWEEELEKGENLGSGFAFYKLETIKIQLISAHGNQNNVEIEDFRRAQPDVIAHSAAKIISRLKAGGEKTTQALKSLCWRCKGIQVEECALIGIDGLGVDLRVCSGTQVQTLRFAFKKRIDNQLIDESHEPRRSKM